MMDVSGEATRAVAQGEVASTVVALFEDAIDAEHALVALRKANQSASRVSLLVHNRQDAKREADGAVDVARDIVAVALGAVANWLIGLAELIVSDRGRYVVAGPMGAALTGAGQAGGGAVAGDTRVEASGDLTADRLLWVLTEFGLGAQEADYVDNRISAGATLVGITVTDRDELEATRRVFGDHDAVYIAVVATDSGVLEATGALLERVPDLKDDGDVVIADVAARVRPVTDNDALGGLRDLDLTFGDGDGTCRIDRVLVEDITTDADAPVGKRRQRVALRYVVISFGGMLGLGRHRVAVPAALVDLTADPPRLNVDRDTLQRAPEYDEDVPLSRTLEEQIFRYFDVTPYWVAGNAAGAVVAEGGDEDGSDRERAGSGGGDSEGTPGPVV